MELLVIGPRSALQLQKLSGLQAIGGEKSTGLKVPGLAHAEDYAVVGLSQGELIVHVLRGKSRGQARLAAGGILKVDDLTLCALSPRTVEAEEGGADFAAALRELSRFFADEQPLAPALDWFLARLIEFAEMEKGVLITSEDGSTFQAVARRGLEEGDRWLTEAIVQSALASRKPLWIHNRVGSHYESSRSLIDAGFLSVFALPLLARGRTLGAFVVGSNRPHDGLSETKRERLETFARLGALLFWFQKREENLSRQLARRSGGEHCPLLTNSPRLLQEIEVAQRVAPTRLSVLIQGETGVGKELMAQWIHSQSDRRAGAFLALNCGAIPGELLESILFGHKRGAFTGAHSDQSGKFVQASGGTLLLDEIGDLPERLQVKLLRVLQEGVVEPLGASKPVKVDVRVLSASHRPLPELVRKGQFRQDLFYRLAETTVSIPPLRERPEDIALLASHFLAQNSPQKTLTRSARLWLDRQAWPGNVRELKSTLLRAAALSRSEEIEEGDFLLGTPRSSSEAEGHWLEGRTLDEARQSFVLRKIHLALERTGGNRQQAAELLGINARTLFRYLEEERQISQ
jgi:DNA-binding NtrC family response regulator